LPIGIITIVRNRFREQFTLQLPNIGDDISSA
jgi:hypothetical protein